MKLTIDTQKDSHEEIRKAIRMLSSLVGDSVADSSSRNIFGDNISTSEPTSAFGSIFGDDAPSTTSSEELPKTIVEEDEDIDSSNLPKVEEYF